MRAEFNQINKHTPSSGEISFLGFQPHVYPYIQSAYPVDRPLVQISTIIYGVLYGLGSPHWIGHPAEQDQVAQERLVEGKGAHGVDTHATVDEFNDGIRVAAPYDPDLIVVVLELCTG